MSRCRSRAPDSLVPVRTATRIFTLSMSSSLSSRTISPSSCLAALRRCSVSSAACPLPPQACRGTAPAVLPCGRPRSRAYQFGGYLLKVREDFRNRAAVFLLQAIDFIKRCSTISRSAGEKSDCPLTLPRCRAGLPPADVLPLPARPCRRKASDTSRRLSMALAA